MRKIGISTVKWNTRARRSVAIAIPTSEKIRIFFLFRLSTKTQINGPKRICGKNPTTVAIARTVADPVVSVRYRMRTNCTILLVMREKVSPVKIIQKVFFRQLVILFIGIWGRNQMLRDHHTRQIKQKIKRIDIYI